MRRRSPIHKRTELQREEDLAFIAQQYCQGLTQQKIADNLAAKRPYKISRQQISDDIIDLKKRWTEKSHRLIDEHITEQLARIDEYEAMCYREYEESRRLRKVKQRGKDQFQIKDGNFDWMTGIQWAIQQRCKILGINQPQRIEATGANGSPLIPQSTMPPVLRVLLEGYKKTEDQDDFLTSPDDDGYSATPPTV